MPSNVIPILKKYYPLLVFSFSKRTIIFNTTYKNFLAIKSLILLLDHPNLSKKIQITFISYNKDNLLRYGLNLSSSLVSHSSSLEYHTLISNLVYSLSGSLSIPNFNLNFFLTNLQSHHLVSFKFSPILTVFNNKPTSLAIVQNIPYLSVSKSINGSNSVGQNNYSYKNVGSIININHVTIVNNSIQFHLLLKYQTILTISLTPTTATKSIDNYIVLKPHQTILISGLSSVSRSVSHSNIPLLSDIPLLGHLFRWQNTTNNVQNFAIFISNISFTKSLSFHVPKIKSSFDSVSSFQSSIKNKIFGGV